MLEDFSLRELLPKRGKSDFKALPPRILAIGQYAVPLALLILIIASRWWRFDLSAQIPAYGDSLEAIWGAVWFRRMLGAEANMTLVNTKVFFPEGWHVGTFAHGFGVFALLVPLAALVGVTLAYNLLIIATFPVAYAGMYKLARRFVGTFPAVVAGLLFSLWGARWMRIGGQLNLLIGSALLPWMVWGIEKALARRGRTTWWLILVGSIWALAAAQSFYFLWIGGVVVAGWIAGRYLVERKGGTVLTLGGAARALIIPTAVLLVLIAPLFLVFFQGTRMAGPSHFNIMTLNERPVSLNHVPIPFLAHPWAPLRELSWTIYRGPFTEASLVNFGLLATIVAISGGFVILREGRKRRWPILIVAVLGMLLMLGPVLKWNGENVQFPVLQPLNRLLWSAGHAIKPATFPGPSPPEWFANGIPLPGLLPAIFIPFWEGARVAARFAFAGGLGFFLLIAIALEKIGKLPWLLLLGALLILEFFPPPVREYRFPPQPHPAFTWLDAQTAGEGEAILDLFVDQAGNLRLLIGGPTIWATEYHGWPIVSGAGSVWPEHTRFLTGWLSRHPRPFAQSDFAPLLRAYGTRYVLFHEQYGRAGLLEDVADNPSFSLLECMSPRDASDSEPWGYPICIVELLPTTDTAQMDVAPREGWSGPEPWGRWATGTQSVAEWVATDNSADTTFVVQAFPFCVEDEQQAVTLRVKNEVVLQHRWEECEPWDGVFTVPASLVEIGWNRIELTYHYSVSPVEVTDGGNLDPRSLSLGFTKFERIP